MSLSFPPSNKMCEEVCRLCMSKDNLSPLFENKEHSEKYSAVLSLTTGLIIEINDELPQQICKKCSYLVNLALNLRNQSQYSDTKFRRIIEMYQSNISNEDNGNRINDKNINIQELQDSTDISGFCDVKVEIEFDRLSENAGNSETHDVVKHPEKRDPDKMTRKQKRQMYMNLVDGAFDPNGPVKCKICKKSVSKWACFMRHAKLHLGFNFMCEYCGKSFISSTQLKRHCRSYHGMKRELTCQHCSYLALDKVQLVLHERRAHTGERPFSCDSCGNAYHSRRCLVQHLESHRLMASVQCEQCPAKLKSRRHLARHRYSVHGLHAKTKSAQIQYH